jgi:hypothetical protein
MGMNLAVLAHFELGEVKAKRLRLPDEVLQLAVCLSRSAGGGQRALDQLQVGDEVGGAGVRDARFDFPRRLRTNARGPEAVRDVEEELAMLL